MRAWSGVGDGLGTNFFAPSLLQQLTGVPNNNFRPRGLKLAGERGRVLASHDWPNTVRASGTAELGLGAHSSEKQLLAGGGTCQPCRFLDFSGGHWVEPSQSALVEFLNGPDADDLCDSTSATTTTLSDKGTNSLDDRQQNFECEP